MHAQQLHTPSHTHAHAHSCTPCEASPYPETSRYWPKVYMYRSYLLDRRDERLSIEIINPWPDLVLRHVKIAFVSTAPTSLSPNQHHPEVKFAPAHGIDFGEINYQAKTDAEPSIRNIIMVEKHISREGRQFYAGICFDAYSNKTGEVEHYGYLLFRSKLLKSIEQQVSLA